MLARWNKPNGYRDVLVIGLPLVVSMGSFAVMQFTDRVFLASYSTDAIAAALPAGVLSFLFISFFMGVANYLNVFIAQYTGRGDATRVGDSLWQGIYFCLISWFFLALLYFPAEAFFAQTGHPTEVVKLETIYFQVLTLGAGFTVLSSALGCFFSGRGLTKPMMVINTIAAVINVPLDYCLINGFGPIPEMGILGAGMATVFAQVMACTMFAKLIFNRENRETYCTWPPRPFERDLFGRLMKFGLPGGVQFFMEMLAIAFFIFVVGTIGKTELAATNIAFSIDNLAFIPMIGLHIAINTMVGQAIGAGRPNDAVVATNSTLHIAVAYLLLLAALFVVFPGPLVDMFEPRDVGSAYGDIRELSIILLRFVALYTCFDGFALIYSGAIKGAGDSRFVMLGMGAASIVTMIIPLWLLTNFFGVNIYICWIFISLYVATLAVMFGLRFRQGKWKSMMVIEAVPGHTPPEGI